MLLITGTVRLPRENLDKAKPAMRAVIEATRAERGCVEYAYSDDLLQPGLIHVNERWASREALDAHMKSAHMASWRTQSAEFGIADRNLFLYETDDGKAL